MGAPLGACRLCQVRCSDECTANPARIPPAGRRALHSRPVLPMISLVPSTVPLFFFPSTSSSHEPVSRRLLLPASRSIARVRSHFLSLRFSTFSFICLSQPDPSCHFPAFPVRKDLALALVSSSRRRLSPIKDDKDRRKKTRKIRKTQDEHHKSLSVLFWRITSDYF